MTELEPTRLALLVVHLIGLACILGPYLVQFRARAGFELRVMLVGGAVQFVTAVALVAVRTNTEPDITGGAVAVKLAVSILALGGVLAAILIQRAARLARGTDHGSRPFFHVAGVSAVLSMLIAVLAA